MDRGDHAAAKIDGLRAQLGPDPVPEKPAWLDVPAKEWEDAWLGVLTLCLKVTRSLPRAVDIRQESYARLLTTRQWTPDRQTTLLRHMMLTASSLLKHESKAARRRQHYEADGGAEYKRERGEVNASPEQEMLEHAQSVGRRERAVRILAELRRRLAGFPLELRLIDRAEQAEANDEELESPAELAKAMGVGVEDVYRARARIKRYRESVYSAVDGANEKANDDEAQP